RNWSHAFSAVSISVGSGGVAALATLTFSLSSRAGLMPSSIEYWNRRGGTTCRIVTTSVRAVARKRFQRVERRQSSARRNHRTRFPYRHDVSTSRSKKVLEVDCLSLCAPRSTFLPHSR